MQKETTIKKSDKCYVLKILNISSQNTLHIRKIESNSKFLIGNSTGNDTTIDINLSGFSDINDYHVLLSKIFHILTRKIVFDLDKTTLSVFPCGKTKIMRKKGTAFEEIPTRALYSLNKKVEIYLSQEIQLIISRDILQCDECLKMVEDIDMLYLHISGSELCIACETCTINRQVECLSISEINQNAQREYNEQITEIKNFKEEFMEYVTKCLTELSQNAITQVKNNLNDLLFLIAEEEIKKIEEQIIATNSKIKQNPILVEREHIQNFLQSFSLLQSKRGVVNKIKQSTHFSSKSYTLCKEIQRNITKIILDMFTSLITEGKVDNKEILFPIEKQNDVSELDHSIEEHFFALQMIDNNQEKFEKISENAKEKLNNAIIIPCNKERAQKETLVQTKFNHSAPTSSPFLRDHSNFNQMHGIPNQATKQIMLTENRFHESTTIFIHNIPVEIGSEKNLRYAFRNYFYKAKLVDVHLDRMIPGCYFAKIYCDCDEIVQYFNSLKSSFRIEVDSRQLYIEKDFITKRYPCLRASDYIPEVWDTKANCYDKTYLNNKIKSNIRSCDDTMMS